MPTKQPLLPTITKKKLVISASRRTDLVSCYPADIVQSIEQIGEDQIHTLALWTKNPHHILTYQPLRNLITRLDQVYLNLTVTGLGGSCLEPGVPPYQTIFSWLPEVIELLGSPQHVSLRYDPLMTIKTKQGEVLTNKNRALFLAILEETAACAIPLIRTSPLSIYSKVANRFQGAGFTVLDQGTTERFMQEVMRPEAALRGIEIRTCAQQDGTQAGGCIDGRVLQKLHPKQASCSLAKDRFQRILCNCTTSQDIGVWKKCEHGCLYCYGNPKID